MIEPLALHSALTKTLAGWIFEEWRAIERLTQAAIETGLHSTLNTDRLPITFVALKANEPVGCVSIDLEDLPGYAQLGPWLASLYVVPERRGSGIGASLVRRAQAFAAEHAVEALYLWSAGPTALYHGLGWVETGRATYHGRAIRILRLAIEAERTLLPHR